MNRPLSIRVKNLFESLLAGAVSLLGFSNCDNQEVMYGTPMSFYEIKGTVTDETGRPVDGTRVIMRMLDNKKALAVRSARPSPTAREDIRYSTRPYQPDIKSAWSVNPSTTLLRPIQSI